MVPPVLTGTVRAAASGVTALGRQVRTKTMLILGERDVRRCLDPLVCLEVNQRALMSLTDQTGVVPTRLALSYPHNPHRMKENDNDLMSNKGTKTATAQDFTLIKPAAHYPRVATTTTTTATAVATNSSIVDDSRDDVTMGLKVVSVRSQNPSRGLPLVPATILLVDAVSGIISATLAGTYITAMRTSAGPALAVRALLLSSARRQQQATPTSPPPPPQPQELVVFGAGAQAECHIQLIELVLRQNQQRRLSKITIINRTLPNAQTLREKLLQDRDKTFLEKEQEGTSSSPTSNDDEPVVIGTIALNDHDAVAAALSTADIISATTNTTTPLWDGSVALKKGCLITSIGSYTPDMQEVPSSVVDQCQIIIDTPETMTVGDLKHLNNNTTSAVEKQEHIHLAGDAFSDPDKVRKALDNSDKDYFFYKAVGTAIQDVLTAKAVVEKAQELKLGQEVDMS